MKMVTLKSAYVAAALIVTAMLSGCTDPAADKEVATVTDAVNVEPVAVVAENGEESAPPAVVEGTVYKMDNTASQISFTGSKLTGTHSGGWSEYVGTVTVPDGDFTKASIVIDIDMNSTFSDDADLTDTLKSDKMFDVAKYPAAKFVSTSIEGADGSYKVAGNLTLHGVTKNLTFSADVDLKDTMLTAESEFSMNRKDFEVNYDGLADDAIREKVVMVFYIEAKVE